MKLAYKPDLEEAKQRWRAFWEHEIIDRPCCVVTAPLDGVEPVPAPAYLAAWDGDYRAVAEQFDAHAATIYWAGEAIPFRDPSFGPEMFGAWLGAEIGRLYCRLNSIPVTSGGSEPCSLCVRSQRWGRASFSRECWTCTVTPTRWPPYASPRTCAWTCCSLPTWSTGRCRTCAGSTRSFTRRFMKPAAALNGAPSAGSPSTARASSPSHSATLPSWSRPMSSTSSSCRRWKKNGPTSTTPSTIMTARARSCTWTQKPLIEWMDLLKTIQAAGKALQIYDAPEAIKVYHRELKPELCCYCTSCSSQREADELLGPAPALRQARAVYTSVHGHFIS